MPRMYHADGLSRWTCLGVGKDARPPDGIPSVVYIEPPMLVQEIRVTNPRLSAAVLHHHVHLCLHFCITYFWNYLILPNNNKKGPGGIVRRIVLEISRANEIIQLLPLPSQFIENKFNTCLINTCSLYYPHNAPKDNLKSIIDNFYRSILSRKFLSPSFFHILTKSAQTIAVITIVHPSTLRYTACAPKESFNGVTWVEGE